MQDKLLFPSEVEAMTRLSQPTIYRLRRKGKFPAPVMLGEKRIAYRQSEIEAWIQSLPPSFSQGTDANAQDQPA